MRLTSGPSATPSVACLATICCAVMVFSGHSSIAQEVHPYRTSQSIALASSLDRKWQGTGGSVPLRDILGQWRTAYSIPVWLDRRIASDLDVATSDQCPTVGDSITEVAQQIHADVAIVDGVVMFVPEGLGTHFESIYWSLATQAINSDWLRYEDLVLSWEDGASARDILRSFVARYPLVDFQVDQIEHDVWAAGSWGKTTPLVVAIVLLGSFDLKPVVLGQSIAAERIELQTPPFPVQWTYREEISKLGKDRWQQWRERWKDVQVRRSDQGGKAAWVIEAPVAAHRELVAPLAPPPKKTTPSDRSKSRYTGRYRGELQSILRNLASQTHVELVLPDLSPTVLRQELDLVFEQASLNEIVERIGSASGLQLQLDEKQLRVLAP